jgi:aspartate kinase
VSREETTATIAVIKIGGSIFTGPISYHRAAKFIERRLAAAPEEGLVVVVSARNGVTDSLLQEAQAILPEPGAAALDLLWSTGELHSVAILALHLQALGIASAAFNVSQTGLILPERGFDAASAQFDSIGIRSALRSHRVVIVPGFLANDPSGVTVTLGRGGSDLTAVLLAAGLGASRCELIKDVPGYFSDDPHQDAHARHLPALSFAQAVAMADAGCDLVQRQALEAAARHRLPLVVRSLDESATESWITSNPAIGEMPAAQTEM